jgi:PAT family beta-lactamase induction signal transducer AmpG
MSEHAPPVEANEPAASAPLAAGAASPTETEPVDNATREGKPPIGWVPSLYFAEGVPNVVAVMVSVLMYKSMGLGDGEIALFTSIIAFPWMLKPLWSPLLETFRSKKRVVVVTQLLTGLGLMGVAGGLLLRGTNLWQEVPIGFLSVTLGLFGLVAFNSATHDIAADGIYVSDLSTANQARFVGVQGAAYNIARLMAQGAFLILAGKLEKAFVAKNLSAVEFPASVPGNVSSHVRAYLESGNAGYLKALTFPEGTSPEVQATVRELIAQPTAAGLMSAWMIVLGLLGLIMLGLGLWHTRSLPSGLSTDGKSKSVASALGEFGEVFRTFFAKKNVLWMIAFICFYRFAEGNLVKVIPLFMRATVAEGGLGLSTDDFGWAYGTLGSAAFVTGSLLGGWYSAKQGLRRSLLLLCAMFNLPMVVFAVLGFAQPQNFSLILVAVSVEMLGYGFGFVGLTLFMMQQVAPGPYKMAHYSFATGIMFLGFLAPSSMSGYLAEVLGYRLHFVWVMLATIPSFFVAWKVPFTYDDAGREIGDR